MTSIVLLADYAADLEHYIDSINSYFCDIEDIENDDYINLFRDSLIIDKSIIKELSIELDSNIHGTELAIVSYLYNHSKTSKKRFKCKASNEKAFNMYRDKLIAKIKNNADMKTLAIETIKNVIRTLWNSISRAMSIIIKFDKESLKNKYRRHHEIMLGYDIRKKLYEYEDKLKYYSDDYKSIFNENIRKPTNQILRRNYRYFGQIYITDIDSIINEIYGKFNEFPHREYNELPMKRLIELAKAQHI